ncbi:S41 family peptidase [Sulfurospirillum arcachonense]|uniref:S41 family peptidase n=1 Tax=Sulfurospirillum arcachonense TaxID=57666 RepID=UPI00046A51B2|nr:S41 family peptidase [Sulfurospirillum arcachonense]
MKHLRFVSLGFATTLLGATLVLSSTLMAKDEGKGAQSRLAALAKFSKVLDKVEQYYVDDLKVNDIVNKSIEGLLSNLDAHSSYLDKKHFKSLKIQTEGEFGGLGITIGMKDGALTIIAPMEGTPADKAGVKASDIILKINEQSTLNMTIDEAVAIMRGKPGTSLTLTVVRTGENKPLKIPITRDIIKIDSVYTKTIEKENILYLRVVSFDKKVVRKTKEALSKNRDIKGIVLDLRNNPGGLLNQAVGLTDLFVDKGVIVSQKGRYKDQNSEYSATKVGTITDIPLVVLVNGGSASASEIVSGALQDHKRAIIVGEKTFGKGSVQVILPVNEEEALRLTIARYYLPSGRTIQAVGVTPDITVFPGKVPHKENEFMIKEKELKQHLQKELEKVDGKSKTKKKEIKKDKKTIITEEDILKDLQLKSAVDIIKVLSIKQK